MEYKPVKRPPGNAVTRVVETFGTTVTIAIRPRDYGSLDGELVVVLNADTAEELMHALEWWKDER